MTSKYRAKIGMMEEEFGREECLERKKKGDQKLGDGKAEGVLWLRNCSGLTRA